MHICVLLAFISLHFANYFFGHIHHSLHILFMLCFHKAKNIHKNPFCVFIQLKIFINIQKLKIFFQVLRWHGLTVLASLFSCQWQRPHHSRRSGVLLFILSSSFHYLIILLFHHLIIASFYYNIAP